MLEKLCNRARHTYSTFCSNTSGGPQTTLSLTLPDDIHDLSAFGGTKGGVIKSPASSPPKYDAPSPESAASPDGLANSPLPQLPAGSVPRSIQQPPFGMPYCIAQDVAHAERAQDFEPSVFVQQGQAMLPPSFESGYSVSSERTQFPPPSQESAQQQNPLILLPTEGGALEVDFEAFGLPPISQQPMQYSLYPQLEQFRDIFMGENTSAQPIQISQDDVWWKFVDDLGFQRI